MFTQIHTCVTAQALQTLIVLPLCFAVLTWRMGPGRVGVSWTVAVQADSSCSICPSGGSLSCTARTATTTCRPASPPCPGTHRCRPAPTYSELIGWTFGESACDWLSEWAGSPRLVVEWMAGSDWLRIFGVFFFFFCNCGGDWLCVCVCVCVCVCERVCV